MKFLVSLYRKNKEYVTDYFMTEIIIALLTLIYLKFQVSNFDKKFILA